ncbi:MAG: hypothetical protein JST02_02155 [Bacteroidetes bacterium]|nr:hypothetical protein [Bacteroidota bacterium]
MAKLHIERTGGLAGFGIKGSHLRSHGEMDTDKLSRQDKKIVDELFKSKGKSTDSLTRDGFTYKITRTTSRGKETIEVAEADMPAVLTACVKDELI